MEKRIMDTGGGKERDSEIFGESNMETYNTICKIDSQWEFAVCLRDLKQGPCNSLEGWGGEGDGRNAQEGGDMVHLWLILVAV